MRKAFLAIVFFVSASDVICAQSTNTSLSGRVGDPAKARIADARVAAISVGTNVRYETATNGAGEYALANLPPGAYRIEVEKPGFKKLIKPDVILHVQDALGLDFEMTVGSVSESITVEGGAPLVAWADLPDRYPSYQTCHLRFQQWVRSGVMRGLLKALAADLRIRGLINVDEAFIDGSFAPAKKGAPRSGKQNEAKDHKSWLWQTGMVSPLPSVSRALPLMK